MEPLTFLPGSVLFSGCLHVLMCNRGACRLTNALGGSEADSECSERGSAA